MAVRHVSCDRLTGGLCDYLQPLRQRKPGPLQVLPRLRQRAGKAGRGAGARQQRAIVRRTPRPHTADSRDPALDRTVLPPAPMGAAVAGELRTSSPAVPRARGGIPWGDSPKMPAPIPFHLPPNPLAAATPPPRVTSGANGGAMGIPAGATPAPMRVTGGPAPGASPVAAGGEIPCPNCGKMVQAGFAFCGACGGRIGRQPSSVGAATGPRTMFMAGANAAPAPAADSSRPADL